MTIFDRYMLRMFLRVLAISFASMTGLFIVIDLFNNLKTLLL
jgi:lipopolysaccharide export LptBFGC system permease protein LptF